MTGSTGAVRPRRHHAARVMTLLLLGALLGLGLASCGGRSGGSTAPAVPGPTDIPPPSLDARPDGRAREFLDLVRQGNLEQAYAYLGTEARGRVSQREFVRQLQESMKTASTRKAYDNRWVQSERLEGGVAIVTLTDRQYPEAEPWRWEFVREGGKWQIRRLYLPPIVTHPRS